MTLLITKPSALMEGGPRDGWAYHLDQLERMVRIEEYFGRTFPYRPTDRTVIHPRTNGKTTSAIWEYAG